MEDILEFWQGQVANNKILAEAAKNDRDKQKYEALHQQARMAIVSLHDAFLRGKIEAEKAKR